MKNNQNVFCFEASVWKHEGPSGWYFASLPLEISEKIRAQFKDSEEGWGRLKANIRIDNTEWTSAIWFDTKKNTYLLPIKAEIRKKEGITDGSIIRIEVIVME